MIKKKIIVVCILVVCVMVLLQLRSCKSIDPNEVALYGEKIIIKLMEDYRSMTKEMFMKKYANSINEEKVLIKKFNSYDIKSIGWKVYEGSLVETFVDYEVIFYTNTKTIKYIFSLKYSGTNDRSDLVDLFHWLIFWDLTN